MTQLWKRLTRGYARGDAGQGGDASRADFRWTYEPVVKEQSAVDPVPRNLERTYSGQPPDDASNNAPDMAQDDAASGPLAHRSPERAVPPKRTHKPLPLTARKDESAPTSDVNSARRAAALAYLLHRLDDATAKWWATRELPPVELLRAGLTALEDGCELDAEHRSLLLRSALQHGRGMLTALRHQDDPERTGLVIAEALTAGTDPVPVETVIDLIERDPRGRLWRHALFMELRAAASGGDGVRRARAVQALRSLAPDGLTADAGEAAAVMSPREAARPGRFAWKRRHTIWLIILICATGAGIWAAVAYGQRNMMVRVPGGEYALPLASNGGEPVTVVVDAFAIDRHEVANRQYRACYGRGRCSWPARGEAAGIKDYFVNPAYDMYPVVNIDWAAATEYCQAQGKRLPTEEEWLVAAVAAPATGRLFTYPWGDVFGGGRANTRESGRGLPALVGSYSPAGDSPSGTADMAGNAAEWTATIAQGDAGRVVKGGSFLDERAEVQASAYQIVATDTTADWIGFRCAAD
jgi:hypothetical protein